MKAVAVACCFSAYIASQGRMKMSRQVFSASREDKNFSTSDIFARLSARCFEKEKHAWTFENNVNNLGPGVEGGLASLCMVSVRCFHAAPKTSFAFASVFLVSRRPVEKGRPF
jgi:hypothetical protein